MQNFVGKTKCIAGYMKVANKQDAKGGPSETESWGPPVGFLARMNFWTVQDTYIFSNATLCTNILVCFLPYLPARSALALGLYVVIFRLRLEGRSIQRK